MLDAVGARNTTLLVVPWYHRGVAIDQAPRFIDAITQRIERGDEVALHGFVHLDEASPPRSIRGYVERRWLTRREGEFAAVDRVDARSRIEQAIAMWRRIGWPIGGFVPPAWLLSAAARQTLARESPFEYIALRRELVRLPHEHTIATDTMWYSPSSAPRRVLSRAALAWIASRASPQRLLRIALHPRDALERSVVDHWRRIVSQALASRTPVTTRGALAALTLSVVTVNGRAISRSAHPNRASARARRSRRSDGR